MLDLNAVLNNLMQMLLRVIGEDISLSFKSAVPPGQIKADPGQIEQILMNLVVNARAAMPDGGAIPPLARLAPGEKPPHAGKIERLTFDPQ